MFNGHRAKAGELVDMSIDPRKLRSLYSTRRVELAPVEAEKKDEHRPIIPKGNSQLDSFPVDVAEELLLAARGDLSPLDWNALEDAQRDERVLAVIPKDEPVIPKGSGLLDSFPVGEAEDILSAAIGDLSAEEWNALSDDERDERALSKVPVRESSENVGDETPVEESDVPVRENSETPVE